MNIHLLYVDKYSDVKKIKMSDKTLLNSVFVISRIIKEIETYDITKPH
jgi:hypothetical protein